MDFRDNSFGTISLWDYQSPNIMINENNRLISTTFTSDKFWNYNLLCDSFIENKCPGYNRFVNQFFWIICLTDSKYSGD